MRAGGRQDGVLDGSDGPGLEVGWRLGGRGGEPETPGHWLELGYGFLALAAGAEMLLEGPGVAGVKGTKYPARYLGMLKGVVRVIRH